MLFKKCYINKVSSIIIKIIIFCDNTGLNAAKNVVPLLQISCFFSKLQVHVSGKRAFFLQNSSIVRLDPTIF